MNQEEAMELIKQGKNTFLTGGAGCVSSRTEFLSPDGWVEIGSWAGQEVMQISEKGLVGSFVQPLKYIKTPESTLNRLTSPRGVTMEICDDHQVAYTVKDKNKLNKKKFADVVAVQDKNVGGFIGKVPQVFTYSGKDLGLSDELIRLGVALKADGSLTNPRTGHYRVNLKKQRKKERFKRLLLDSGTAFKENYSATTGYTSFSLHAMWCTKSLDQFKMCSLSNAEVIWDEILYWDGSTGETGRRTFSSSNAVDAEVAQYVASLCGVKANITMMDRRGQPYTTGGKQYIRQSVEYVVVFSKQTHVAVLGKKSGRDTNLIEKINTSDGYKYCFTVPTGYLLFRLEGKIFVSGNCGKSYTIKQITNNQTVLLAPTGIAALNIGGTTCHSTIGLPFGYPVAADWTKISAKARKLFGANGNVKRIILDEVSMVSAVQLDIINKKLQIIRNNKLPFGGIQMVVVGDMNQLSPVITNQEAKYFYKEYDTPYAFGAKCWDFVVAELTEVKRQGDKRQVNMLNAIRTGSEHAAKALYAIQKEAKTYNYTEDTLHLCVFKEDAGHINRFWFDQVEGKPRTYFAKTSGDRRAKWSDVPVPEVLDLKVGCKVVCAANDLEGQYVNGSKGTVIGFGPNFVRVRLDDETEVIVEEFTWEKFSYSKGLGGLTKTPIATFTQVPLRLGYAITAHSSQGVTLDSAAVHIGRGTFSAGQLYVMLSRVTDLRNLSFVEPIHSKNIIVSEEVQKFYANVKEEEASE